MIICVLVKAVPDTATAPMIADDGRSVLTEDLKFVINPYDEHALEEAIVLGEHYNAEVVALGLGGENARAALRTALSLGAARAVLVQIEKAVPISPIQSSSGLVEVLREMSPDLILAGRQAVDTADSQVGERVAEKLQISHVSNVIKVIPGEKTFTVFQESPEGHRVLEIPCPALLTVQKGINVPRYPTVPEIMKAKRKPIEEVTVEGLGVSPDGYLDKILVQGFTAPESRRSGQLLSTESGEVSELILRILRATSSPG